MADIFFQIFLQKLPENIFCGIIVIWLIYFQKSFIDFFLSLQWCFSMISFWHGRFFSKTFLHITFSVSLWDGWYFFQKFSDTSFFFDWFSGYLSGIRFCYPDAFILLLIPGWYHNDSKMICNFLTNWKKMKHKYSEISTEYYSQVISPNLLNRGSVG